MSIQTTIFANNYIFTPQGVIAIQGGPEAINVLKQFADDVYKEIAQAYSTYDEA